MAAIEKVTRVGVGFSCFTALFVSGLFFILNANSDYLSELICIAIFLVSSQRLILNKVKSTSTLSHVVIVRSKPIPSCVQLKQKTKKGGKERERERGGGGGRGYVDVSFYESYLCFIWLQHTLR